MPRDPCGGYLAYSTARLASSSVPICGTITVLAPMSSAFLMMLASRLGTRTIGTTPFWRHRIGDQRTSLTP